MNIKDLDRASYLKKYLEHYNDMALRLREIQTSEWIGIHDYVSINNMSLDIEDLEFKHKILSSFIDEVEKRIKEIKYQLADLGVELT